MTRMILDLSLNTNNHTENIMAFTPVTIEPTTTITLGEQTLIVAEQTDEIQRMVKLFDQWRERDAELTAQFQQVESDILCTRSAMQHLQNTLLTTLTADNQPDAVVDAPTEVSAPTTVKKTKGAKKT